MRHKCYTRHTVIGYFERIAFSEFRGNGWAAAFVKILYSVPVSGGHVSSCTRVSYILQYTGEWALTTNKIVKTIIIVDFDALWFSLVFFFQKRISNSATDVSLRTPDPVVLIWPIVHGKSLSRIFFSVSKINSRILRDSENLIRTYHDY